MLFVNLTEHTLKFVIGGQSFAVEPCAECSVPDVFAYAVKAYGLPLTPVGGPAIAATSAAVVAPADLGPKVGETLICADLLGVMATGTVLRVSDAAVILELEDGRRWPVRLERVVDGTWTHDTSDYEPGFLGLDDKDQPIRAGKADAAINADGGGTAEPSAPIVLDAPVDVDGPTAPRQGRRNR